MKLIRNIIVVVALILLVAVIGLALGGQGDGGGDVQTTSPTATAASVTGARATSTRPAAVTATMVSGSEGTSAPTAVPTATEGSGVENGGEWGIVVRVADGDTLTVRFGSGEEETIRLLDVDTPETVHPSRPEECFGAQASDYTKGLMRQRVRVESMGRDRYGRLLAYVWTGDGEDGVLWNVRLLGGGAGRLQRLWQPGSVCGQDAGGGRGGDAGGSGAVVGM